MIENWKLQTRKQIAAIKMGAVPLSVDQGVETAQSLRETNVGNDPEIYLAPDDRFIDEAERLRLTSVSQSTWYRWIHLGLAPEKYLIGPNTAHNLLSEVQAWMAG
jgi:predicted DNA-binding transcriptional regulator AlpA